MAPVHIKCKTQTEGVWDLGAVFWLPDEWKIFLKRHRHKDN